MANTTKKQKVEKYKHTIAQLRKELVVIVAKIEMTPVDYWHQGNQKHVTRLQQRKRNLIRKIDLYERRLKAVSKWIVYQGYS